PRIFLQFVRPAQCQVAQPGSLSLDADRLLERDGFVDRSFGRRRTSADLFEFADILSSSFGRRLQRPGRFNAILSQVEQAGPEGREQPFVEADAVIVHFKVAQLERKVAHGMSPVDDRDEAASSRHQSKVAYGKELS